MRFLTLSDLYTQVDDRTAHISLKRSGINAFRRLAILAHLFAHLEKRERTRSKDSSL